MTRTPTPEDPMTVGELRGEMAGLKDDAIVYLVVMGRREPLLRATDKQHPVWGAWYLELSDGE